MEKENYVIFKDDEELKAYCESLIDNEDKIFHIYCYEALLKKWTKQEIIKAAMEEGVRIRNVMTSDMLTDCREDALRWHQKQEGRVSLYDFWPAYNGSCESYTNQERVKKNLPLLPEYRSMTWRPNHLADGVKLIIGNLFKKEGLVVWRIQPCFIDSHFIRQIKKLIELKEFQDLIKEGYIGFTTCSDVTMVTKEQMEEFRDGCVLAKWDMLRDENVYKKNYLAYYCDAKKYFDLNKL